MERGLARNTDPDTSHEAADQVDASGLMQEIYAAMSTFGDAGCTADDIEDYLSHLQNWTISPRYKQMVERGMIEVTGEKRVGKSNRMLMVRRVLKPPFKAQRKIVPSLPEDEPGKRVKYFQTQEGLDSFVETLKNWTLKPGLNIRITVEVMR